MKTGTNIETIHMEESETIDNNLKGTKIIISNHSPHSLVSIDYKKMNRIYFKKSQRK